MPNDDVESTEPKVCALCFRPDCPKPKTPDEARAWMYRGQQQQIESEKAAS